MPNQTLNLLRSLRTIHWEFNDKTVSDKDIETIIEHSLYCANSNNIGDFSVIVVDDPEVISVISGNESGGKSVKCLIYCMDHTRIIKTANALGYKDYKPSTSMYHFMIAMYDVIGAAQTAVIAAKAMGIDSLVTNFTHRNHPKEIRKFLDLPSEYCMPIIAVALGYSDKGPDSKPRRLNKKHIIHWGKYRPIADINTDEIIAEMDNIYPEYISEKYPHTMDWYFSEWLIEHYDDPMYKELIDDFRSSNLLLDK